MKTLDSSQQNSSLQAGPILRFDHRMRMILVLLVVFGIIIPLTYGIVYANFVDEYRQCGIGNTSPLNCYGGHWQQGHIGPPNDIYVEGMAVLQRALWSGIGADGSGVLVGPVYTYTWWVSSVSGDLHGYDFLVSVSQATAINKLYLGDDYLVDLCGSAPSHSQCSTIVTPTNPITPNMHITVPFPLDPFISGTGTYTKSYSYRQLAFDSLYGQRYGDLYANNTITSAVTTLCHTATFGSDTCLTADGSDTGGGLSWIRYQMVFTTSATAVGFWYGGHLALSGNPLIQPMAWGPYLGAAGITGASWHVKSHTFNGKSGSQDNQVDIYAGAPYPFTTLSTKPTSYGSTITATDSITVPQSTAGNADIRGTITWYMCADTTLPYSPTVKTGLPNGCTSTQSSSSPNGGFTSTYVGTRTLTVLNTNACPAVPGVNNVKCSIATSPAYTVTSPGYYCWLAIYTPTLVSGLYQYSPSADTDRGDGTECFIVNQPTAVTLSSFDARVSGDSVLGGFSVQLLLFGLLGIATSTAVWWLGFKRD